MKVGGRRRVNRKIEVRRERRWERDWAMGKKRERARWVSREREGEQAPGSERVG